MGAYFKDQRDIVRAIRGLDPEIRNCLGHHLKNSLFVIKGNIEIGEIEEAQKAIEHMESDLKMFGI